MIKLQFIKFLPLGFCVESRNSIEFLTSFWASGFCSKYSGKFKIACKIPDSPWAAPYII